MWFTVILWRKQLSNQIVSCHSVRHDVARILTSAKTSTPCLLCCFSSFTSCAKFTSVLTMLGYRKPLASKPGKAALMELGRNFQVMSGSSLSKTNKEKSFTIAVEGNIGSGKTTLLEYFQSSPNVEAIKEPIEQWTNVQGHNALSLLYQDPSRWSFSFNMYASLTRVQMHTKAAEKPVKMLERSLHSTRYCFVENDFRNETINGLEYSIITEWFNWLTRSQKIHLDLIVYLQCPPEICYERVKKRDRKEESSVPQKLLEDLHNLHEEWLIEQKHFKAPAPVLVLDASKEYGQLTREYEVKRHEILCGYS